MTTRKVNAEKLDPSGANEGRKERAKAIDTANKAAVDHDKAEQAAAKASGMHEAKLDDAGAREQQRTVEENGPVQALAEFDGPPISAPMIETGGTFKLVKNDGTGDSLGKNLQYAGFGARVQGKGYFPGEVIVDVRRVTKDHPDIAQDHQRFSTMSADGTFDTDLGGIASPGMWLIHTEQVVTHVGEGRDDHLPRVLQSKEVKLELS